MIWSLPRPATPAGRTFPSCCASCAASSTRRSLEHQGQATITMRLAVAIQMDPIEPIAIPGDSSFVLALEAQRSSEARRAVNECVSTCSFRWAPHCQLNHTTYITYQY